jgi:hypothetical protein
MMASMSLAALKLGPDFSMGWTAAAPSAPSHLIRIACLAGARAARKAGQLPTRGRWASAWLLELATMAIAIYR